MAGEAANKRVVESIPKVEDYDAEDVDAAYKELILDLEKSLSQPSTLKSPATS